MRLFVAVVPPAPAALDLERRIGRLRSARPDLRWSAPASWHLTLAFLPEVAGDKLPTLVQRIRASLTGVGGPVLRVEGSGAFPDLRRARVVWAGVRGAGDADDAALARVVTSTRKAVRDEMSGTVTAFTPHLTLARTRTPCAVRDLVAELATYRGPTWAATEVRLVESRPGAGPGGRPHYETVEVFALTEDGS